MTCARCKRKSDGSVFWSAKDKTFKPVCERCFDALLSTNSSGYNLTERTGDETDREVKRGSETTGKTSPVGEITVY